MEDDNKYLSNIAITDIKDVEVNIDYADNDIIILDSIKLMTELSLTQIQMNMLAFCNKGKVQMNMNGRTVILNANQILICPSNTTFSDFMISPDFDFKVIFISNRMLNSVLREKMSVWTDLVYNQRVNVVKIEAHSLDLLAKLADIAKMWLYSDSITSFKDEIKQSLLRACILSFCGIMQSHIQGIIQESITVQSKKSIFRKFMELLQISEVKHKTVEYYSKELCISPKYLSAICRQQSGKTASEWICEYVMEDIRYYLKQTDYSIKEISNILGFPNTSFFGKYVKKHFGMSPMLVRNKKPYML